MLPEFKDQRLLNRALTHASWANEHDAELAPESAGAGPGDNERLEFLGDAVLDFVAGAWLFQRFPEFEEGRLTRVRAALVRATSLARFAEAAGLPSKLRLGKGEAESGRTRTNILADAFEALLGALYLDQGTDAVRLFLEPMLEAAMPAILSENLDRDFKTRLQEWSQAYFSVTPRYKLTSTTGPDHARVFTSEVWLGDLLAATGAGQSKQVAEQIAAREAVAREDALAREWLALHPPAPLPGAAQ